MWRPLEDHCRHCYPWEKLKSKQSEPTGFASSFCPLWADSKWDLCKRSSFGSMALPARAREMGIRVSAGSKAGGGREALPLEKRAGSFPTSGTLLHSFPASHVEVGKGCPHLQRAAGVPGSWFTLLLYLLWIHPGKPSLWMIATTTLTVPEQERCVDRVAVRLGMTSGKSKARGFPRLSVQCSRTLEEDPT